VACLLQLAQLHAALLHGEICMVKQMTPPFAMCYQLRHLKLQHAGYHSAVLSGFVIRIAAARY
jgi:hypothetical protein